MFFPAGYIGGAGNYLGAGLGAGGYGTGDVSASHIKDDALSSMKTTPGKVFLCFAPQVLDREPTWEA